MHAQRGKFATTVELERDRTRPYVAPNSASNRLEFNITKFDRNQMTNSHNAPSNSLRSWLIGPWSKLGLTVALVSLVLDQVNKWWMIGPYQIEAKGRVKITPFLDFVYAINKGVSYGMLSGTVGPIALSSFALLASLALVVWLAKGATNRIMAWSIGLIIGGAVGNAIDRFHLGGVADFFQLHGFGYSWYIFNIADIAIVAGVIGLLYDSITSTESSSQPH
jgi:signal peptidase II